MRDEALWLSPGRSRRGGAGAGSESAAAPGQRRGWVGCGIHEQGRSAGPSPDLERCGSPGLLARLTLQALAPGLGRGPVRGRIPGPGPYLGQYLVRVPGPGPYPGPCLVRVPGPCLVLVRAPGRGLCHRRVPGRPGRVCSRRVLVLVLVLVRGRRICCCYVVAWCFLLMRCVLRSCMGFSCGLCGRRLCRVLCRVLCVPCHLGRAAGRCGAAGQQCGAGRNRLLRCVWPAPC